MKIDDLFKKVQSINNILADELLEISVKQHQITISVKEQIIYFPYVRKLINLTKSCSTEQSFVSILDDVIYFSFQGLSSEKIKEKDDFYLFMTTIEEFADKICTCPSLEFIISPQYLKCFLDKPGLTVDSLIMYEKILEAEGKGELELHPQRPYLLFINEKYTE